MDALDVRILRVMGVRPYDRRPKDPEVLKPPHIARELGLSVNTVKERIARMEADGVIAAYQIVPNFRHLGLAAYAHKFRADPSRKDAAVRAAAALDGILEVHDFIGPSLCVDFAHRGDADRLAKIRTLAEATGDMEGVRYYERAMPPVSRELSTLDWRILQALRWRANRPLAEVADELGVALRTVRRHFDRMASEGSFFVTPLVDPGKASGLFLFDLICDLAPLGKREAIRTLIRTFDDRHVYAFEPAPESTAGFDMLLFARTSAEVEAVRREAAAVPGVVRAEANLFRAFLDESRWLDAAIAARVVPRLST
ncbi:MAG TPA: winged helix-turn-helix transcriptional regulator [Candidatus Thermoplasmatota archaeon]|nr:winged helix-turn-helix transcriptional regulator [Candidatus Thermoplasmatota archaeon]